MNVVLAVATSAGARNRNLGSGLDRVAGVAIEASMRAIQSESGLRVVIEAPAHPSVWIVALSAVARQPALMMLILMTTRAGARRLLERGRAVAFLARDDGVTPNQRESRYVVIEGHLPAPPSFLVALLAARAELGFVGVILLVAGDAGCCELVAIEVSGVTGIAFDLRVRASQRELGHSVVIEFNRLPLGRGVARFALGAIPGGVSILQAMAGDAGGRQVLVAFAGMAGGATNVLVGAIQSEFRLAVIKRLDAAPAILAVAAIARLTEPLLVRLLRFVAVIAAAGGAAESDRSCVAAVAADRLVAALELEIGGGVIEGLAVELDNIGVSTLVVGVTILAVLVQSVGLPAVKASTVPAVIGGLLVARDAEAGLRLPGEWLVAAVALLFELGVPGNQRAWHHKRLEDVLRSCA